MDINQSIEHVLLQQGKLVLALRQRNKKEDVYAYVALGPSHIYINYEWIFLSRLSIFEAVKKIFTVV